MGIFDGLRSAFTGEKEIKQELTNASQQISLKDIKSAPHFRSGNNEVTDLIFGVVNKLVNTVSMADLEFFEGNKKVNNDLTFLLKYRINPYQSFLEFMVFMETQRNLKGNAFAYIKRGFSDSDIQGIYPLFSNDVEVHKNTKTNTIYYKINGIESPVDPHDMIHVKFISVDGYHSKSKGNNPIAILDTVTRLDNAVMNSTTEKLVDDFTDFIINDDTQRSGEHKKAIYDMLAAYYNDSGGIIYNDFDVDIQRLESNFNFTDLEKTDKSIKSRLSNVFNMPVTMIGAYDYNGIEETNRFFIQSTIAPILKQYADQFTNKLLSTSSLKDGAFFRFDNLSLIQYDLKTQAEYYKTLFRNSMITADEVRVRSGLDPRGGNADILMISGDMYPADTPVSERNIKVSGSVSDIKGGD